MMSFYELQIHRPSMAIGTDKVPGKATQQHIALTSYFLFLASIIITTTVWLVVTTLLPLPSLPKADFTR